jgi:tetratricopeptide (TPR) repeat protein
MCQEFLQKASDAVRREDFIGAEGHYLACLKCDPQNAEAYRELGMMYWANFKKTTESIDLIEKSLILEDCADGHFYLAMVNQRHDRTKALDEFQKAIAAYKANADASGLLGLAHCNYALVLAQDNKFIEAEEHFLEALRIDPENGDIQKYNANFQRYKADFQKCLREIGQDPSTSPS